MATLSPPVISTVVITLPQLCSNGIKLNSSTMSVEYGSNSGDFNSMESSQESWTTS